MISFLRKIRQNLLRENKITRYLAYAIGEIFLVVIGILIALQINNANESNKLRKKEVILLSEMKNNLQSDLLDLEFNIDGNKDRLTSNRIILTALQDKGPFHDSLKPHFGKIFGNYQLSENTASWENLKSVGLDLVSNDSLRNRISNLYSTRYPYLENVEKGLDDRYQWNFLYPLVLKNIAMDQIWVSASPQDYDALLANLEFQEVLKMNVFIREFQQNQYEEIHGIVGDLVKQIDRHLSLFND
ncbi:DUF6090 family protein [Algoriphagus sp.]|jgi:hypothetical protein|uniref:DUF6090 family protein n=1 Tax=Algoriphagus sp. TaxID=1872435 RepID=UPI00271DB9D9|nr:DUF6090 family protein [Algoriphagus sp.]MDO8966587.1 DUF6090 family protein [Algoriphagus sp.]MDP3202033.1 DUF6090 family protein [Algoriphagus sp.]